mgnify:CR=1 FL=1
MSGFDGRVFLTNEEHATYCRRAPVRYAARNAGPQPAVCQICKMPPEPRNPLEAAHRVPFTEGVIVHRLTPDWLDGAHNLVWAHRKLCNTAASLTRDQIAGLIEALKSGGVVPEAWPPIVLGPR